MRMYRQGDVLIVEDLRVPNQRQRARDNVLVYGEATGHAHRVEGSAEVFDTPRGKEIAATEPFRVVHEEHDTIEIPEGFYRVVRQREYDEGEIRYVSD
jgi:hypothetical protein